MTAYRERLKSGEHDAPKGKQDQQRTQGRRRQSTSSSHHRTTTREARARPATKEPGMNLNTQDIALIVIAATLVLALLFGFNVTE